MVGFAILLLEHGVAHRLATDTLSLVIEMGVCFF